METILSNQIKLFQYVEYAIPFHHHTLINASLLSSQFDKALKKNRRVFLIMIINSILFEVKCTCVFRTAVGIRGKDGVVFGVEKLVTSKLYEAGANKRLFNIDRHIGIVSRYTVLLMSYSVMWHLVASIITNRTKYLNKKKLKMH